MTINPDTNRVDDNRTVDKRHDDLKKAVMKVFADAAKECPEYEQKILEDLAPVVSEALSAGIRAYNVKPKSDW